MKKGEIVVSIYSTNKEEIISNFNDSDRSVWLITVSHKDRWLSNTITPRVFYNCLNVVKLVRDTGRKLRL